MVKISKDDQGKLIIVGVFALLIAIIAAIYTGTRYVPLYVIGAMALAFELLFCMPYICKQYYWLKGYDIKFWPIPYVNVIQCFSAPISLASIVFTVLGVFGIIFLKLPLSVLKLFGEDFIIIWSDRAFFAGIISLIVVSILWGVGYSLILKESHYMIYEATGGRSSRLEIFYYILLFLPILRVCGLVAIVSTLSRLKSMGYYEGIIEDEESYIEEGDIYE